MRILLVTPDGVIDTDSGEIIGEMNQHTLLKDARGGVIVGRNMYPQIAPFVSTSRSDHGWSAKIHAQQQRKIKDDRVSGVIYFSRLTYRFPKKQIHGKRSRVTVKWLILNMELFSEDGDVLASAKSLIALADARGISPRFSPGSFGSALLRASPQWPKMRRPAPWFISEAARSNLPGNYYAIREGYGSADYAYYLDQSSAHHTVASEIDLPHPHYLRARGRFRMVEKGSSPRVFESDDILTGHVGVVIATVECNTIPPDQLHLYPAWARKPGIHSRWIWTPELRMIRMWDKVKLLHISSALTSIKADDALREYANWSLEYLKTGSSSAVKPSLLAAYGMLAVQGDRNITVYSAHGRGKPKRADIVSLPLLPDVFRSNITGTRVPSVQNVVARGVIESEVKVRTLELAIRLENEGIQVVHIYADGLIAKTDQLPFMPNNWRVAAKLTDVSSPAPHSIVSNEMVRLPGIPNGRRHAFIRSHSARPVVI